MVIGNANTFIEATQQFKGPSLASHLHGGFFFGHLLYYEVEGTSYTLWYASNMYI